MERGLNTNIRPLDLPMKPLRQTCPVAGLDQERNGRIVERLSEVGERGELDLIQAAAPQHEIQVAAIVAPAVHPAAVGPDLHAGEVFAQQGFEALPVARQQVEAFSHRAPAR